MPHSKALQEFKEALGLAKELIALTETFLQSNLNYIVDRRHEVAHAADALNISQVDLQNWVHFLDIFAESLDERTEIHILDVIQKAKKKQETD